jgi:hypothetical protein
MHKNRYLTHIRVSRRPSDLSLNTRGYNGSGQCGVTVLGIEVALRVKYDGYDDSVLLPAEFVQMGSPSARQGTTTDVVTDTWGEQHAG